MVPRRSLRSMEPRRDRHGPRRRRLPHRGRAGLRVARRHPASRRLVARLLPLRRLDRGRQARHQRVRLHRHRRLSPPAQHVGPRVRREHVAHRRTGARVRAVASTQRRTAALGGRARGSPLGLCAAHRHLQHPACAALRRASRRERRRGASRLDRCRRRDGRRAYALAPTRSSRRPAGRWTGTTPC